MLRLGARNIGFMTDGLGLRDWGMGTVGLTDLGMGTVGLTDWGMATEGLTDFGIGTFRDINLGILLTFGLVPVLVT